MTPRLKIALVSQPYDGVRPPQQNSVGISVYELSRALARQHEVTVVNLHRPGFDEPNNENGVRFHYLAVRQDVWLRRQRNRIAKLLGRADLGADSAFYYLPYALRAALVLRRNGVDVIHLLNLSQFVPVMRTLNPRARILLNMRCEWLSQFPAHVIGPRLRRTDRIVGCSRHITDLVAERFPEYSDRCRTVYNGVDTDAFEFVPAADRSGPGRPHTILFVGRVSPEKGVHVLIDALPEIVRRIPDIQVKLVGGTEQLPFDLLVGLSADPQVAALKEFYRGSDLSTYLRILKDKLAATGLTDRVTFTGNLPYQEVREHLSTADVLVNPSLSDAFPRAPIEAMATGLPVVAARVGGVTESVRHGTTGLLVKPGSPNDLADAVARILSDDEFRSQLGMAGRRHIVENFSWPVIAAKLEQHYLEMIDDP